MNKFATGLITGSIIGAIGLTYALNDKRTRRRMIKDGKNMISKASSMIDDMKDGIW